MVPQWLCEWGVSHLLGSVGLQWRMRTRGISPLPWFFTHWKSQSKKSCHLYQESFTTILLHSQPPQNWAVRNNKHWFSSQICGLIGWFYLSYGNYSHIMRDGWLLTALGQPCLEWLPWVGSVPHVFHCQAGMLSQWRQNAEAGKAHYTSISRVSACVMYVNIPLAEVSQMAKARARVGGLCAET